MDEIPTEDVNVDMPEAQPDVTDLGDGTSLVDMGASPSQSLDDHSANLAETLDDDVLNDLSRRYLELIDRDIEGREPRDKQYADGLKKTGIAEPAPGGAPFEGASRATHPVLAESYVDFSATAIKELFPPNGPVRSKIDGKPNHDKIDRATRKAAYLNKLLTQDVREYRGELERLLTQLPPGGSQYMKAFWNEDRKCVGVEFVPIDDFILPYNAKSFFGTQRKFQRMHVDDLSYQRHIELGEWRDWTLPKANDYATEPTKADLQTRRIEGKVEQNPSDDMDRLIYEGVVYEQMEGDDKPLPYLLTLEYESGKVLGYYKNWAENDPDKKELDYVVDFTFIPWRGALGIGLPQLIGGLSDALTGSLRALLDSALINNMPGALKLKSMEGGSNNTIDPTQVTEIDGMGSDDIRKLAMPLPFNPPSPMLFQLLGFLTSAAKEVVGTAEEKIADANSQMAMGTALALIEQGAKVFSSIHARLHDSQRRLLEIIHRLVAENMPEKIQYGSDPQDFVTREDFQGAMDVHPVSDPNIFSETQRFAQVQAIIQMVVQFAPVAPQILQVINLKKLIQRSMEMMKFPDYEEILPPDTTPIPTNPADENVDLVMGKPVKAFQGQDHQAHIQVHLDFAQSPFYGLSPVMPPTFGTNMLNHIMDHLLNFYQEMMKLDAGQTLGDPNADMDATPQASEALAKASQPVMKATQIAFGSIPGLMQQAIQHIKQNQPPAPQDPMAAVAMANVQSQEKLGQGKLSLQQQQHMDDMKMKQQEMAMKAQELQQDYNLQAQKYGLDQQSDIQTTDMKARADLQKTSMDNQTAKEIAAMNNAHDHVKHLIDGATLNKANTEQPEKK